MVDPYIPIFPSQAADMRASLRTYNISGPVYGPTHPHSHTALHTPETFPVLLSTVSPCCSNHCCKRGPHNAHSTSLRSQYPYPLSRIRPALQLPPPRPIFVRFSAPAPNPWENGVFRIIPITDARDTCLTNQPQPRDLNVELVPFNFFPHPFILAFVNHPVVMSTSTTTTQILFNSPALRSLKREQLLKLCKIHNVKATGKSVDLIERLKHHATALPPDAPLNVAVRSEVTSDFMSVDESQQHPPHHYSVMPRPSEAWEVVMDDIQEAPETSSTQNTLNSLRTVSSSNNAGEFGTAGSKCKPIVFIV